MGQSDVTVELEGKYYHEDCLSGEMRDEATATFADPGTICEVCHELVGEPYDGPSQEELDDLNDQLTEDEVRERKNSGDRDDTRIEP